MAPNRTPATASTRGCLSSRQWSDIRQAARLARTEGVTLVMHGVKVSPHHSTLDAEPAAQKEKTKTPARDEPVQQSKDPDDCKPKSKKALRDADRLQEFQEKKRLAPIVSRWEILARQPLRACRRMIRDAAWTSWMLEKQQLKVQCKLRPLLWQAWTQPTKECKESLSAYALADPHANQTRLETCSPRDRYILYRVRALCRRAGVSEEPRHYLDWKDRVPALEPAESDMEEEPQELSDADHSSSSDGESHGVTHAGNDLATIPSRLAGVKHASTPTAKDGGKKSRALIGNSPMRANCAL